MIHGLFDEYTHYHDYPLEALATTAVLFGGIISHRLISDLPLQIGLGISWRLSETTSGGVYVQVWPPSSHAAVRSASRMARLLQAALADSRPAGN